MATDISICSTALLLLGEDSISAFNDNVSRAKICGAIYPDYIKSLLSSYPWKFTLKKQQLSRLTITPKNKWKYAYQLPSDLLVLRAVYDNDSAPSHFKTEYEKFGETIHTDYEEVYIDYQQKVSEADFPPYFTDFVKKAMASEVAMAITDDRNISNDMHIKAFGSPSDNLQGGEFGKAKRIDSSQNPTPNLETNDILLSRFI